MVELPHKLIIFMPTMKNYQRALRRFHAQRIINKRKKTLISQTLIEEGIPEKRLKKYLKNPVTCSCWMCGNPRKYFSDKTYQELKADEKFRLELKNLAA